MIKWKWLKRVGALSLALSMVLGCATVNAAGVLEDEGPKISVIDTTKDVTLTIHKYEMESIKDLNTPNGDGSELDEETQIPSTAAPLKDVTFAVYKVAADATSIEIPSGAVAADEKITGADGIAKFTGLAQGRYLVVETKAPEKVYEKSANFLVDLPMMSADGTSWNYDVHAYPKNAAVVGAVVLTKKDADTNKVLSGAKFILQQKVEDNYVDMKDSNGAVREFTTDGDGKIVVNGLLYGEYQFVETKAPADYGINKAPISFKIEKNATVASDGKQSANVVNVTANDVKTPTIDKKADKNTANIGDTIMWTLTPSVPSDIASYTKYEVTDTLDSRLTYVNGSVEVYLDGKKVTTGFTTDITAATSDAAGNVKVVFTDRASLQGKKLEIQFKTTVNTATADNPGYISNKGNISYKNAYGTEGKPDSNEVKVYVGNIKVIKYEAGNEKELLAGAQFAIYSSEADAKNDKNQIGKTVTTNESGAAYFKGFAAGDYWLVEKVSPTYKDGTAEKHYLLMTSPEKVTVSENDKDGVVTVKIANKKQGFSIPKTGGAGTLIFLFAGLMMISGATFLLVLRKRRLEA